MKRSTSWIAVLPSLVIPVCVGLSMYLGLSYLIKVGTISNEMTLRYLTGHAVSEVTVAMFFIGVASLGMIGWNVFNQFFASKKITIKPGANLTSAQSESIELTEAAEDSNVGDRALRLGKRLLNLPRSLHEHYLWQRLVNSLHSIYRTNSTSGVEEELKYLADVDLDRQEQRYSLVRILIWATPMLGFLGTVLGISQALGGINVGPDNNFQDMMNGLRSSLYVAFDTTALALTLSMVLMFCQFLVDRFESQLLLHVHQRARSEISSQFDMTEMSDKPAFQKVADELLAVTRESVAKQTETWRQTIRAAEQAWTASLSQVNDQVQVNLSDALDENVSNLAHYLGEAIEKADSAMSHRWEQWQVTLSSNAQLMSQYQRDLADQTVSIKQLMDQASANERYESAIARNQDAIAGTAKLRDSLDALARSMEPLQPVEVEKAISSKNVATPVVVEGNESDVVFQNHILRFRSREELAAEQAKMKESQTQNKAVEANAPSKQSFEKAQKLVEKRIKGTIRRNVVKADQEKAQAEIEKTSDVILPIRSFKRVPKTALRKSA